MDSLQHPSSPSRIGPSAYALAALVTAGLVFAGFGFAFQATHSRDVRPGASKAAAAVMGAPVGVDASPVLSASGTARADGAVQRVDIDASSGEFLPDHISVAAFAPIELRISRGSGHSAIVVFEELHLSADLSEGPAVLRIPPLEPGTYPFGGADGTVTGLIVAD